MNNDLFKEYAITKQMIKTAEEELKQLQPEILKELKERTKEMEDKNLKFEFGTFSITERKTWTYSEKIDVMEIGMKKLKKMEEETGVATATVTESLRYQ